ncbi:MAG: preprotein translocase subunit SecY [Patescibacteria group bacterium]|nr:preprotein translocase subunit SecY [Patescibacteria group bacterium]
MRFWDKVIQIWRIRDLRKKIFFVLAMLFVFRVAAHIPVPGVDVENLKQFFNSNQVLGLLNVFSGGALENFSIVMLGVAPYITASIIMQLLTMIIPRLEEMQKEGERGQQRINQFTRLLAIPLAALQAYGTITLLRRSSQSLMGGAVNAPTGIIGDLTVFQLTTAIVTLVAGSIFLMWIGELISEKQIGNGVSLIIFAGIVAGLSSSVQQTAAIFDPSKLLNVVIFLAIAILTIAGVVFITEGQRNIPVSYARQIRGRRVFGGTSTHLPMRVNQAGVIPIIFAISLLVLPPVVAQFLAQGQAGLLANLANSVINLFNNQLFYGAFYFVLVVVFTYFYTAVIFHPDQIAENLQKQGGFIPGIRPGRQTAEYLNRVSNRILLTGALFLGLIAVLPFIVQGATGIGTFVVGGTSLLIVVSVVIETVKQINSQLQMRDYEGF